jgi:hypothetical protein
MPEVIAIFKDVGDEDEMAWEERLEIRSVETAKEEIGEMIKNFNNTLREGEKPRKFIRIKGEVEKEINLGTVLQDLRKLLGVVRWEYNNAFGNAWCKENLKDLDRAYETFINTHRQQHLKRLLSRAIIFSMDKFKEYAYLQEIDFLQLIKDERKARED